MLVPIRIALLFLLSAVLVVSSPCFTWSQQASGGSEKADTAKPEPQPLVSLSQAVMCEKVDKLTPINEAAVFSIQIGQCSCFTVFDPVDKPSYIFHRWYHKDELSTQIRLRVYPPRWATYSLIHLREADKGPWRVEITDENGTILKTLRFGITD